MSHENGEGPGGGISPGPGGPLTTIDLPGNTSSSPSQATDLAFPSNPMEQFVTFTGDTDGFYTPNPIFIIPSYDGTITPLADSDGTITPIGCC